MNPSAILKAVLAGCCLLGTALYPALSGAQPAATPPPLTIGLISASTAERVVEDWKPFTDALSRELKLPVRAIASTNYSDIAAAMKEGRVQVAWLNNKLSIDLVESESATVFAQMVRADGTRGYKSLLLVHKDSPISSLADVLTAPGKYTLGTGRPQSLSGSVVPHYYVFAKNRIDPAQHFKAVLEGSHLANLQAVADRKVDIATNNTEEMPRYLVEFPGKLSQVRVLWESPLIPNDPILMRNDLDPQVMQKTRRFFLAYGSSEAEKETLKRINGLSGFKPSSNFQLRPVVDIEMFQALTRAMSSKSETKAGFDSNLDQLTKRAARLDALLNSTRFDSHDAGRRRN